MIIGGKPTRTAGAQGRRRGAEAARQHSCPHPSARALARPQPRQCNDEAATVVKIPCCVEDNDQDDEPGVQPPEPPMSRGFVVKL
jgi:hypothetical protein